MGTAPRERLAKALRLPLLPAMHRRFHLSFLFQLLIIFLQLHLWSEIIQVRVVGFFFFFGLFFSCGSLELNRFLLPREEGRRALLFPPEQL